MDPALRTWRPLVYVGCWILLQGIPLSGCRSFTLPRKKLTLAKVTYLFMHLFKRHLLLADSGQ